MKSPTFFTAVVLATISVAILFHYSRSETLVQARHPGQGSVGLRPPSTPPISATSVKPEEWHQFQTDREAVLGSETQLASEYQTLLSEMVRQQKDLEAAMLKADPRVADALSRLQKYRAAAAHRQLPHAGAITPEDMESLRTARLGALRINPDLDVQARQLAARMKTFQQELSAAMVKRDPSLPSLMGKLGQP